VLFSLFISTLSSKFLRISIFKIILVYGIFVPSPDVKGEKVMLTVVSVSSVAIEMGAFKGPRTVPFYVVFFQSTSFNHNGFLFAAILSAKCKETLAEEIFS